MKNRLRQLKIFIKDRMKQRQAKPYFFIKYLPEQYLPQAGSLGDLPAKHVWKYGFDFFRIRGINPRPAIKPGSRGCIDKRSQNQQRHLKIAAVLRNCASSHMN
jgi:hypothetical protein